MGERLVNKISYLSALGLLLTGCSFPEISRAQNVEASQKEIPTATPTPAAERRYISWNADIFQSRGYLRWREREERKGLAVERFVYGSLAEPEVVTGTVISRDGVFTRELPHREASRVAGTEGRMGDQISWSEEVAVIGPQGEEKVWIVRSMVDFLRDKKEYPQDIAMLFTARVYPDESGQTEEIISFQTSLPKIQIPE